MSQLNKTVNLIPLKEAWKTIQQYPIQFVANNGEIFIISYKSRDLVALMLIMAYDIPNLRDKFASLSKVDIYNEIILKLPEYFPTIFLNFCEEYLKTVRYDHESLVRKIREKQTEFNENIQNFINFIITKSRNKEMPDVPFFFSDDISRFCFKPSSNNDTYVTNFCKEFTEVQTDVSADVTALSNAISEIRVEQDLSLHQGACICGYTLFELVSKKDETNQIWKVTKDKHLTVLKFSQSDHSGNKSYENIINHYKDTDREYIIWGVLKKIAPNSLVRFMWFDYYAALNLKIKLLSYEGEPVSKCKIEKKKDMLTKIIDIISVINKEQLCICNLSPEHFLKQGDKYTLIDYKYVRKMSSKTDDIRDNLFSSISLISKTFPVTFYDDIESYMYIFQYLLTESVINNEDKDTLSTCLPKVREFITNLRIEKSRDDYIAGRLKLEVKTYTIDKVDRLVGFVKGVIDSIPVISDVNLTLSPSDQACVSNIKIYLASDLRYSSVEESQLNEFAVQIMNYMKTSCQYSADIQARINDFLS